MWQVVCKLQVNVMDIIATVTNSKFFQFSLGESKSFMFTCRPTRSQNSTIIVVTWVSWMACSLWTGSLVEDRAKKKQKKGGNGPFSPSSCSHILLGPSFLPEPVDRIGDVYLPKKTWCEQWNYIYLFLWLVEEMPHPSLCCEFYQCSCTWHNKHIEKRKIVGKGPKCLTVHYFLLCFQAIIHPDTGKKVLMPFRMSGLFVQKKLIILTLLLYYAFS